MSSRSTKTSRELAVAMVRESHLIGRFKVFLKQTQNHPDQRALDQSWVDQLVERIGSPDQLNRALHPICVILQDDSSDAKLQHLHANRQGQVPDFPEGLVVKVFAGQHRLAMLGQLDMEEGERWWHADVYKSQLETEHPAEFLTMMHESNTPQVMKMASNLDLFRAVYKLKGLLDTQAIDQQTFLQSRRMLLRFDERTNRAICNLTRNNQLMDAVMQALSRPHIATVFSAGSWMRLTTGRLYMVAAGLVREMVAQVDLLTEGMSDVPEQVLDIQPRKCVISRLKVDVAGRKKQHAWDILPGGKAKALERVINRPPSLVTHLNPKKNDPWSLPDLVLLPSCLGSKLVEDELKLVQTVIIHVLKMIATEKQFDDYLRNQPDSMESSNHHPAGLIASYLAQTHGASQDVSGYDSKIMHLIWKNRSELQEQLEAQGVPDVADAVESDYQKLITNSKAWWTIMRLFKVHKIQSQFQLSVPRTFGLNLGDNSGEPNAGVLLSSNIPDSQSLKRTQEISDSQGIYKRVRGSVTTPLSTNGGDVGAMTDRDPSRSTPTAETESPGTAIDGLPTGQYEGELGSQQGHQEACYNQGQNQNQVDEEEEEHIVNGSDSDSQGNLNGPVSMRRGGDRRLKKTLDCVVSASNSMTRAESRAMTNLLEQIMQSSRSGNMEQLLKILVAKGEKCMSKFEKQNQARYDSGNEEFDEEDEVELGNRNVEDPVTGDKSNAGDMDMSE
ncbi:hypothetical protein RSOL_036580, partial [Rhizoctonia solani AG-3 Rhs1AP]